MNAKNMMNTMMNKCMLCPRKCGADRTTERGFCGAGNKITVARASLHKWEEPCISYKNGAGTIFFSGCNLHCCFCQNNKISNKFFGKEISEKELADIFLSIQDKGADNIDLVTPTHFVPYIINALDIVKHKLNIPVVYNCGGYETCETIELLNGYIDIYLPDIKYFSSEISQKYSNAPDYFEIASAAVLTMIKQIGSLQYNCEGGLIKGTIIRHLVLPSQRHDSMNIMKWIANNTSSNDVLVSIMNQYTPFDFISDDHKELKRHVTKMEYNSVVNYAAELGIKGFTQQKSSASEEYVPDFDLTGI
ncbi:MAG: radical SAM protein [Ruminococcus sp.]|uniref:radical SAM protein n=1 Tax=Ruminococcus sp. TaxID=41978 RepID=UPI001B1557ED|nr:radical SAM protein [Ruminococcus sp.]MBO7473947.1 radical SAM protein [Ruminococcus sp.]